jgi:hypothetical protein
MLGLKLPNSTYDLYPGKKTLQRMQNPRIKAMIPIQQKFAADCAVACLSMFLGVEYEEVLRHVSGHELTLGGLTNYREAYIAQLFEVEISFLDRTRIDRSKAAVLTVPSLNSKTGLTHAVYWDGTRIYESEPRP